jgi:hypothetical protein
LVGKLAAALGELLDDLVSDGEQIDGGVMDVEFVVIELVHDVLPLPREQRAKCCSRSLACRGSTQPGYGVSQRIRNRVEEIFGWAKTVGAFRRTRFRGSARTQLAA